MSPAITSRSIPPAMAVSMPMMPAANHVAPASTAIAASEVAKNPIPIAPRTRIAVFIRSTTWASGVAMATASNATVMLGQCWIE